MTYLDYEPIGLFNGDSPYADTPHETASAKAWAYIAALLTIGYLAGRWAHARRVEDAAHDPEPTFVFNSDLGRPIQIILERHEEKFDG